jgi:hypothetical protein
VQQLYLPTQILQEPLLKISAGMKFSAVIGAKLGVSTGDSFLTLMKARGYFFRGKPSMTEYVFPPASLGIVTSRSTRLPGDNLKLVRGNI